MARTEMWVHGVAFEAGFPAEFMEAVKLSALHNVERSSSGSQFKTNLPSVHVFHVSIPSPTILNDFRMQLFRVFLFYQTVGNAKIKSVSVYDGRRLVHVFDNLGWSGNHNDSLDASNQLKLTASEAISNGIGIFVVVEFGAPPLPPATLNSVLFSTAGVRFVTGQRLITTIILWLASLFEKPQPDRQ